MAKLIASFYTHEYEKKEFKEAPPSHINIIVAIEEFLLSKADLIAIDEDKDIEWFLCMN